jgi:hypothetical protein
VLPVEPRGLDGANEELGAVGVPSGVGHGCDVSHVGRARQSGLCGVVWCGVVWCGAVWCGAVGWIGSRRVTHRECRARCASA